MMYDHLDAGILTGQGGVNAIFVMSLNLVKWKLAPELVGDTMNERMLNISKERNLMMNLMNLEERRRRSFANLLMESMQSHLEVKLETETIAFSHFLKKVVD
jgi:transcriptional regulator GlxA family with amidase domain